MRVRAGGRFNLTEPALKVAEYVALAEEKGLNGISWLSDSQLIWRDVYASLVLALQKTQNIHLGPGVTNPVTRDPTVTAGAIATVEELTPGRVVLGMGVGDSAVHTIHRSPATLQKLKESVQVIRNLLDGKEVQVDRGNIRLTWTKTRIPIYIASTGPKSLKLAAQIGDGVIVNVGSHPGFIEWALEQLAEGAKETGRSIHELDIWVRLTCYPNEDADKARSIVRGAAATKANGLARYAKDQSFRKHMPKELIEDIEALSKQYDYYEHQGMEARHISLVTDRILDNMVVAGTPSYCISRLEEIMNKSGVNQFSFAIQEYPDIPSFIKKFAAEVISPLI